LKKIEPPAKEPEKDPGYFTFFNEREDIRNVTSSKKDLVNVSNLIKKEK
jgi:hypothetical protein